MSILNKNPFKIFVVVVFIIYTYFVIFQLYKIKQKKLDAVKKVAKYSTYAFTVSQFLNLTSMELLIDKINSNKSLNSLLVRSGNMSNLTENYTELNPEIARLIEQSKSLSTLEPVPQNFGRDFFRFQKSMSENSKYIDIKKIRDSDIIFIGGYGRSGTTLMRAILDVHPNIRCGPETKVIPVLLNQMAKYLKARSNVRDLSAAGIKLDVIDDAISAFIYHIIESHGKRSKRLCIKDPDILYHIKYLNRLFPKAKYVHMVRDGRAAAFSFMMRVREKLTFTKFRSYLNSWNSYNRLIDQQCTEIGPNYCILVKYEELVVNPKELLKGVVSFIGETWTEELMRHERHFHDEIQVSRLEWSTDQIRYPINKRGLQPVWIGRISNYDHSYVMRTATMLKKYGYNLTLGETTNSSTSTKKTT